MFKQLAISPCDLIISRGQSCHMNSLLYKMHQQLAIRICVRQQSCPFLVGNNVEAKPVHLGNLSYISMFCASWRKLLRHCVCSHLVYITTPCRIASLNYGQGDKLVDVSFCIVQTDVRMYCLDPSCGASLVLVLCQLLCQLLPVAVHILAVVHLFSVHFFSACAK